MIPRKKKLCNGENCERVDYIVGRGLCTWCYNDYLKKKAREKKEKSGEGLQQRQGAKPESERSEIDIYNEIWAERPHKSEIDGTPLFPKGHKMWHWQFLHCCPKSIYNRFRLRKDNIFLGTVEQHILQTMQPQKTKSDPKWDFFWNRYNELKSEYNSLDK